MEMETSCMAWLQVGKLLAFERIVVALLFVLKHPPNSITAPRHNRQAELDGSSGTCNNTNNSSSVLVFFASEDGRVSSLVAAVAVME
jgi:hypothetical protein